MMIHLIDSDKYWIYSQLKFPQASIQSVLLELCSDCIGTVLLYALLGLQKSWDLSTQNHVNISLVTMLSAPDFIQSLQTRSHSSEQC